MQAVSQALWISNFPFKALAIEKLKSRFLWISPLFRARTCNMNGAFGSFVHTAFLFNNNSIYCLQKPVFFLRCNLLIRFPPRHRKSNCALGLGYSEDKKVWVTEPFLLAFKLPLPLPAQISPSTQRDSIAGTASREGQTGGTSHQEPVHVFYFMEEYNLLDEN